MGLVAWRDPRAPCTALQPHAYVGVELDVRASVARATVAGHAGGRAPRADLAVTWLAYASAVGSTQWILHDPARIDVWASRAAGEPRRSSARIEVHRRANSASTRARLLFLHEPRAARHDPWIAGPAVLDVGPPDHGGMPAEPTSPFDQHLAGTDADLASLRSALLDLDAVVAAWPEAADDRCVLVASGTAAAAALIALGAGLAPDAGQGDPLRHELLLDLLEGDALLDRVVDRVTARVSSAVLVDPAGADADWRDTALARVATPLALLDRRVGSATRRAFAAVVGGDRLHAQASSDAAVANLAAALVDATAADVFADVVRRPEAFGVRDARLAHGHVVDNWPTEICRSDFARDLAQTLWDTFREPRAWAR